MTSRAIGRGLARIEPPTSNILVAYAAKAGSTAADGDGLHSPFTLALLKNLVVPDLDIRLSFGRVRDDVIKTTGAKQEPFVYGSLGGDTVTLASLTADDRQDRPIQTDSDLLASRDYEATTKVDTKEAWDLFLRKYPTGFYADLARAQRSKLTGITPTQRPQKNEPSAKPSPSTGRFSGSNISCCLNYYHRNAVGGNPGNACNPATGMGRWNLGLRNWCTF
jgi:hypothetical protein